MKIDIDAYNNHYHQSGKFIDKFQEGIKLTLIPQHYNLTLFISS